MRIRKTRKYKKGGSGIKLSGSFINRLTKAKDIIDKQKRMNNYKKYKSTRKLNNRLNIHPELTNANVENLKTLNISGPEWNIMEGNRKEKIPTNLLLPKRNISVKEISQGVRVFQTRR